MNLDSEFDEIVADIDIDDPTVPFWEREHEGRYSIKWNCRWDGRDAYVFAPSPAAAETAIRDEYDIADDVDVTIEFRTEGSTGDIRRSKYVNPVHPSSPEAQAS